MVEFTAWTINALIGVRTKIIALGLQKVRAALRTGIAIEEGERRCHGRNRNACLQSGGGSAAPSGLQSREQVAEPWVNKEARYARRKCCAAPQSAAPWARKACGGTCRAAARAGMPRLAASSAAPTVPEAVTLVPTFSP